MIAGVFVDANIIVYSIDQRDELKHRVASEWMRQLWREQRGRTSIQALNEFYWVATRKLKPIVPADDAWHTVELLLRWKPQVIDQAVIRGARSLEVRHQLSWWDALIVSATQLQGCGTLLTEDLQHGSLIDGVRICNPFVTQVQEPPAPYEGRPISRHRPRGRPRKAA